MKTKKITSILLASALSVGCAFAMTACDDSSSAGNDSALLDEIAKLEQQLSDVQKDLSDLKKANETPAEDTVWNFSAESYEKLKYIDAGLSDRDCFDGKHFKYTAELDFLHAEKRGLYQRRYFLSGRSDFHSQHLRAERLETIGAQ